MYPFLKHYLLLISILLFSKLEAQTWEASGGMSIQSFYQPQSKETRGVYEYEPGFGVVFRIGRHRIPVGK